MNRAKHVALATEAQDASGTPTTVRVTPGSETSRLIQRRAVDSHVAGLEEELLKLRKRYRARELAMASMAGAVATLRRANRALNDENALLRQQVAELKERASSRAIFRPPHPQASGGK